MNQEQSQSAASTQILLFTFLISGMEDMEDSDMNEEVIKIEEEDIKIEIVDNLEKKILNICVISVLLF